MKTLISIITILILSLATAEAFGKQPKLEKFQEEFVVQRQFYTQGTVTERGACTMYVSHGDATYQLEQQFTVFTPGCYHFKTGAHLRGRFHTNVLLQQTVELVFEEEGKGKLKMVPYTIVSETR
jgi:hypothetical protein